MSSPCDCCGGVGHLPVRRCQVFWFVWHEKREKKKKGKTRENNEKKHESQAKSGRLGISGYDSHNLSVWLGISWRVPVSHGLSLLLVLVLAPRVFLRVLRFSSLHKNQHFQISSGITGRRTSLWRRHCKFQFILFYLCQWPVQNGLKSGYPLVLVSKV